MHGEHNRRAAATEGGATEAATAGGRVPIPSPSSPSSAPSLLLRRLPRALLPPPSLPAPLLSPPGVAPVGGETSDLGAVADGAVIAIIRVARRPTVDPPAPLPPAIQAVRAPPPAELVGRAPEGVSAPAGQKVAVGAAARVAGRGGAAGY